MAKRTIVLQVFVASPNDLKSERVAVESVIRELNQLHSKTTGAYLDLFKWETLSPLGFGSDPKAVINEQIEDEYDIFIGILATHFGSPQLRGSGSEEELNHAYNGFTGNPSAPSIMFYFKDPELRASEIEVDQYKRVTEFKNKLWKQGVSATFTTIEDFVPMVRLYLSRQVRELTEKKSGSVIKTEMASGRRTAPQTLEACNVDEYSRFVDYVEIGSNGLESGIASLERIEEAIADVESKTAKTTPKLAAAIKEGDVAKQKQILNIVARALEEFGLRVDTDLRIFSDSYSTGMDAISKSVILWEADSTLDDKLSIQTAHDNLELLLAAICTTRDAIVSIEQTIYFQPRSTANFNEAKNQAARRLGDLHRAVSNAQNLTNQALGELKHILGDTLVSRAPVFAQIGNPHEPTEEQLIPFMQPDTLRAYLGDISVKRRQEIRKAEVARWKATSAATPK